MNIAQLKRPSRIPLSLMSTTLCNQWIQVIEEGSERQVTSYLHQWTQLNRLHGQGVAPVQPYSCPEMWLYWQGYIYVAARAV